MPLHENDSVRKNLADDVYASTDLSESSEAAKLGGMAMKWRWREKMKAADLPADLLLDDLRRCIEYFEKDPVTHPGATGGFNHG